MLLVGSLLATACVILVMAPLVLAGGRWQVRYPRTALTLWFCALFGGIAAAVGSVAAAFLVAATPGAAPNSTEVLIFTMAGWLSLGILAAVIAFVSASAEPLVESWRESVGRFSPVAIAREEREGFTLVWFESDEPFACAVPSADPEVFVSTALRDLLTAPQLRAVIEHERAHLRQHHGWAVRAAEINALCMPRFFPAGRALKRATLLLVELVADDTAARRVGAVHLANALAEVSRATGDAGLQLRADRLTMRRWKSPRRERATALARA